MTALEPAPASIAGERRLFFKREDEHELGAFKWRGALPAVSAFKERGATAIVTASTGNHAAATAWAAARLGVGAVVFAPASASRTKLELVRSFGARIHLVEGDFDETKAAAAEHAADEGLPFFEDGAERAQYDGYRAIGAEILNALPEPPAVVVVPVGNGALLGGIGLELCEHAPATLRIGVVAKAAPVMADSWEAGEPVASERSETIADGLAVRVPVELGVAVLGEVATAMLRVSEREIASAMVALDTAGVRAEGAAAAGIAALPQLGDVDGAVVAVITGRNVDDELLTRAREHPESFPD